MPQVRNIIEGLQIIAKYRARGLDCYAVQAEHDEIFSGPDDDAQVTAEDLAKLEALGWHDDRHNSGCFQCFV